MHVITEKAKANLRVGVVGCGRVAHHHHLPVLRGLPDVRLVAVADTDPVALRNAADQFGVEHRFQDYRLLLERAELDVVAVCTPVTSHVEIAAAALEAGKHVLVEKPLALTLDEADRLLDCARRARGKAVMGFNMRHHRLVRQAREWIRSGRLGTLVAIRSLHTSCLDHRGEFPDWRRRRATGGGVLFELAVHHFDLWRLFTGCEAMTVQATSRTRDREDETVSVNARLADGIQLSGLFSDVTSQANELEFFGTSGSVRVSCYRFDGLEICGTGIRGDWRSRLRGAGYALRELRNFPRIRLSGGDWRASYRGEWQAFLDSIRTDQAPASSLEDGRRALEMVLGAARSNTTGQTFYFSPPPGASE